MRMVMRRLRRALRLDAAERAAQFVQLPFIGEFLALGDFDEFKDFVHLVVQFLEGLGDKSGVFHGLRDGRRPGGAEISGLHPLTLADRNARWRLRRTLIATRLPAIIATVIAAKITPVFPAFLAAFVPAGFAGLRRFRRGRGFNWRLRLMNFGVGRVLMGTKAFGRFGMRLAKSAAGFGFVLRVSRMFFGRRRGGFSSFRCGGNFFSGGRVRLRRTRPGAAATATTTAAAATTLVGTARGVQIGFLVRHNFPVRMAACRLKAKANYADFFTNSASEAVKPCRKFFSPTGPISPLQKNPAMPVGPKCACTSCES